MATGELASNSNRDRCVRAASGHTVDYRGAGWNLQGVFFDWSPPKSLSIEILYENT